VDRSLFLTKFHFLVWPKKSNLHTPAIRVYRGIAFIAEFVKFFSPI
jgi:hypothetical protein